MTSPDPERIALALVADGKGILAADETVRRSLGGSTRSESSRPSRAGVPTGRRCSRDAAQAEFGHCGQGLPPAGLRAAGRSRNIALSARRGNRHRVLVRPPTCTTCQRASESNQQTAWKTLEVSFSYGRPLPSGSHPGDLACARRESQGLAAGAAAPRQSQRGGKPRKSQGHDGADLSSFRSSAASSRLAR
jgi:hypothetical protein